jgi:poly(3-hydroxybutyrate) depolymerase
MGDCPRDCIAPEFAPRAGGNVDFTARSFSLQLPAGYDPKTAYPVFMGGGGCGSGGGGYAPPGAGGAIRINLAIKNGGGLDGACFADGGQACSGNTTTLSYCVNSPEMAYVRGILSYVESHYCVDLDKEFIGGASSGAWEAYTLGCGDADQLRGIVALAGGKRENRWKCTGPVAAFMIADKGDGENPIMTNSVEPHLDSHGSLASRDELLVRNGCVGTASTVYDPKYPSCLKYTGCPAAYPVIWCALNGGHVNTTEGGVNYQQAIWPFFMSLPPAP